MRSIQQKQAISAISISSGKTQHPNATAFFVLVDKQSSSNFPLLLPTSSNFSFNFPWTSPLPSEHLDSKPFSKYSILLCPYEKKINMNPKFVMNQNVE